MSDNVTISNGLLPTYDVLSDDVGGKHCQIVKLSVGGDGVGTAVTTSVPISSTALEVAQGAAIASKTGPLIQSSTTSADPSYTTATVNPLSTDTAGRLRVVLSSLGTNISVNNGTASSATQRVTIASDSTGQIKEIRSGTGTVTSVADTATSATILAANTSRLGATITNDSSGILYVRFAAGTASTTNYSQRLSQHQTVTVPANYTGIVVGIWATDPNDGAARVTEFTV